MFDGALLNGLPPLGSEHYRDALYGGTMLMSGYHQSIIGALAGVRGKK
jgi:hypothetical protein